MNAFFESVILGNGFKQSHLNIFKGNIRATVEIAIKLEK
jgi:hypothetical protein